MDTFRLAKTIVSKLAKAGYTAYFAGGWVRDYVMGHPSEDIDIATNATPVEIMDLFPNTILVGLAFGVVIVLMEGHQFEVATFRKDLQYVDGRHPEGIEMSTPKEDALRRDFTINGMFYDPLADVIHDFVHGQDDIKRGVIRTIGNPYERFFEDRLRMLRAFRFASRFSFIIEAETQEAIREMADKLFPAVAMERVWQEFNKMANYPRFDQALVEMHRLSLLDVIFPELENMHIKELKHLVQSYAHFPPQAPTIVYLMALFPAAPLSQKIEIAKRIKATNRDIKLIEFLDNLTELIKTERKQGELEPYAWIHALAHPDYRLSLDIIAAVYPEKERMLLLQRHQERFDRLQPHIKRIRENKPLVSAALLKGKGISPGKHMGALLKEAEKIAVNENYQNGEPIIDRLACLPIWKNAL
ncbi:CCA tRNA nucleotidyltransferase [Candidatus Protochlamydia phocaeensis]|uniref:CCA tRNA nucleotidyltransferase n=1 Tax=Candidatus Protochlamydia phocaeensis TaxID=1414722 RepID=UPI000838052F|nr:CCA tRNA nucleotidyltransferase [Candidatus Protochlamydia phocaeensis]